MGNESEWIGLVDASWVFCRYWHAQSSTNREDTAVSAMKDLQRFAAKVHRPIVCLDSPPYARKAQYPEYKANREEQGPEFADCKKYFYKLLLQAGFEIALSPGQEADDVIATLVEKYRNDHMVILYARDKDMLQLLCSTVYMLRSVNDSSMVSAEDCSNNVVPPVHIPLWLALMGDKADNIPGVPGLGKQRARALVTEFPDYVSLADAVNGGQVTGIPPKSLEALDQMIQNGALMRNLQLVTLNRKAEIQTMDPEDKEEVLWTEESGTNDMCAGTKMQPLDEAMPKPQAVKREASGNGDHLDVLKEACRIMAKSSFFAGQKPQDLFVIAMRGHALGLDPVTSQSVFCNVKGKMAVTWQFLLAAAKEHPDCEFVRRKLGTATESVWQAKRKGEEMVEHRYTIEDAKRAGVVNRMWESRPTEMLSKTCCSQLVRMVFPDSRVLGLYSVEELG